MGQELVDPDTGARLRFLRTARSTGGEDTTMQLRVREGWSAGPLHVHPRQSERMRILEGVFRVDNGGEERVLHAGDSVDVPPRTRHTIRLLGQSGALEAEFVPALRTDELFETMFGAGFPRRPPGFVPSSLRAWLESRGFSDEIRYLWPRRAAAAVAALAILRLLRRGARAA